MFASNFPSTSFTKNEILSIFLRCILMLIILSLISLRTNKPALVLKWIMSKRGCCIEIKNRNINLMFHKNIRFARRFSLKSLQQFSFGTSICKFIVIFRKDHSLMTFQFYSVSIFATKAYLLDSKNIDKI